MGKSRLIEEFIERSGVPAVILVIDELPYLTADDVTIVGTLQKVFDKVIARHRVLLIGIGLQRMGAAGPAGATGLVGSYWTRRNDPEIDLVLADHQPASSILGIGSITWHQTAPLVAVSRTRIDAAEVIPIKPADLLSAW